MLETKEAGIGNLAAMQALELGELVDLEACWENLRKRGAADADVADTRQDLQGRQKAYDLFRAKLAGYNKKYTPEHVPELLLNTPVRLALWCRRMRDLYLLIEQDPKAHCPVYLLEKAYRWADRVSARMNRDRISRSSPPANLAAAIRDLEAVSQWCDDLARVASPV